MPDDRDDTRGFRVTDRRRFSDSGESRPASAEPAPPVAAAEPAATPPAHEGASTADEPVTFSTFILGLSTQALLHLGDMPNPATGRVERDLLAAKHVIDILGILRDKTRGNVEPAEEGLLDSMLYDLRMRYVALVRSGVKEGT
jgi:hypothetical protein